VAMCEAWTKREQASARHDDKEVAVAFYSHHPGWSDTDAVRSALPGFYDTLKGRLRSPLEGADTVIWLAAVDQTKEKENATKTKQKTRLESGGFYFDRRNVAKHVGATFFATTRYSPDDVEKMERLLVAARDAALERKSFSA
jgi:dehydrogenase/reductase SDR family protein 12